MINKADIKEKGLLFDGAFGTYFTSLHPNAPYSCEIANLKEEAWVEEIHKAYIDAGAQAIKTNTFCSDAETLQCENSETIAILRKGYQIAKRAVGKRKVLVFADIGPIMERKDVHPFQEYKRIVDIFLDEGAENFIFETLHNDGGMEEIVQYIKAQSPNSFILVSFAVSADGYTRQGISGQKLFMKAQKNPRIDALGFNCVCGPHHLQQFLTTLKIENTIVSIMPNAGYPTILKNRTFFADTSTYFAQEMQHMKASGACICGGCCGTTPQYIEKVKQLWNTHLYDRPESARNRTTLMTPPASNSLLDKLKAKKKIIAVELDPPANCDIQKFMENALTLQEAGVDTITIADCPIARARVDSSLLAAKVKRELGMEVIPHMTCRDRNINATKALLFGLQIEAIHNVLIVTGDPIPQAERNEVKAVFNFNSQILSNYIHDLNETTFPQPFTIYGALNVNAVNFKAEIEKAKRKIACGVSVFMSQPVLSKQALQNLKYAKETLDAYILGGIIPIVSHRNAIFMNNEIAGIHVADTIIERYENVNREEAENLSINISNAIASEIEPYVDGFYLITPFNRVEIINQIAKHIKCMNTEMA